MFERYSIEDLFLAFIHVRFPENDLWDVNVGGILMMSETGYGYLTILKKDGDQYIDLGDTSRPITTTRDSKVTSYIIDYIEPFSKYYIQKGEKKKTFSKRKALLEAQKYYNVFRQEYLAQIQEQQPVKKLSL